VETARRAPLGVRCPARWHAASPAPRRAEARPRAAAGGPARGAARV